MRQLMLSLLMMLIGAAGCAYLIGVNDCTQDINLSIIEECGQPVFADDIGFLRCKTGVLLDKMEGDADVIRELIAELDLLEGPPKLHVGIRPFDPDREPTTPVEQNLLWLEEWYGDDQDTGVYLAKYTF